MMQYSSLILTPQRAILAAPSPDVGLSCESSRVVSPSALERPRVFEQFCGSLLALDRVRWAASRCSWPARSARGAQGLPTGCLHCGAASITVEQVVELLPR